MTIWSSTTANARIRTIIIGHPMPKKLNITAKIAPDVLLQEFKIKEFYFFAIKISLFRKYVSYFKYRFDTPESLTNKGIKEKPIEMSYHKGSDFNRFFIWCTRWESNPESTASEAVMLSSYTTSTYYFFVFSKNVSIFYYFLLPFCKRLCYNIPKFK